eukprot:Hpha_TRINITY_DN9347_c0_g2::TRINITY_DN9347_c0_g2_i1::g.26080::m.26080
MQCPAGCSDSIIPVEAVRDIVSGDLYQRFLDARLEKEWAGAHPDEVVQCPSCRWMGVAETSNLKWRVVCPNCSACFCGLCGDSPHHSLGLTCEEVAAQKR